jgi:tRNA wybutosine-synthesizing protein 3
MQFDLDKKNALTKLDKSKKGSVDHQIKSLVDLINQKQNFYTSSSCSGRIILFSAPKAGKKDQLEWLFVSHEKTSFTELKKQIKPTNQQLWLRQESFILHICCRTIDAASKLLTFCRNLGLKRAGINSISKKIVVEIINTPNLNTMIGEKNEILVNDKFLKTWVREANKNMKKNKEKICFLTKKFISL